MENSKFIRCKNCGNLVTMINDGKGTLVCCQEPMELLVANVSEGASEKHIPDFCMGKDVMHVKVGSILHPASLEHHIEWIAVETSKGIQMKKMDPVLAPKALFNLNGEHPIAIWENCNLHGLWKVNVEETYDDLVCCAEFSEGCI